MDVYEQICQHMESLGLQIAPQSIASLSMEAGRTHMENIEFLAHVVDHLLVEKRRRSFAMLLKLSGIPVEKTLDSFDFVRVSLKVSTDSQEKCFHYIAN